MKLLGFVLRSPNILVEMEIFYWIFAKSSNIYNNKGFKPQNTHAHGKQTTHLKIFSIKQKEAIKYQEACNSWCLNAKSTLHVCLNSSSSPHIIYTKGTNFPFSSHSTSRATPGPLPPLPKESQYIHPNHLDNAKGGRPAMERDGMAYLGPPFY